jgi:tetratricopeptide (TPR) repeat protein
MYASAKDYPLSETCMLKAISLDSTNADYWYNYGGLLFTLNDREGAKKAWARTLALKPDHPDAIKGLEALGAKK